MPKRRTKGDGTVFQTKDGTWIARLELPADPITGKRRRKQRKATSQSAALKALRQMRLDYAAAGDLATAVHTVDSWMQEWLPNIVFKRVKPSTYKEYRSKARLYIVPFLGKRRLDKLTPTDLTRLYDWMTSPKNETETSGLGLSITTARQTHAIIHKALNDAMRQGLIMRNVADLVDPPGRAYVKKEALTAEEALHFFNSHYADPYMVRYMFGLICGVRQGEALGLQADCVEFTYDDQGRIIGGTATLAWSLKRHSWEHGCGNVCGRKRGADCPNRTFNIRPDLEAVHVAGGLWLQRPKTPASYREIALPPLLAGALAAVLNGRTTGFVFREPSGWPVDSREDWQIWKDMLREAGLPEVDIHSMRHTSATLLNYLGVDAHTRMSILGHTSEATTSIYTRQDKRLQLDALSRLESLIVPPDILEIGG